MSMMVNGVSNVSFRSNTAPVNTEEFLSRPGSYSRPMEQAPAAQKEPKKHSFLKTVAGLIAAAVVVAGGLWAAHKYNPDVFNAAKKFADFEGMDFMPKWKGYITTAIGQAGKYIDEKAVSPVVTACTEFWAKHFAKPSEAVAEAADAVEEVVETAAK